MTVLVLSRHLPISARTRIETEAPGVRIVCDGRAELSASGRVGLLYREQDRSAPVEVPAAELTDRWAALLREADVLFDIHPAAIPLIPDAAPRLSFIQAIAAGAGELLAHRNLRESGVTITTARGVHDDGLADFVLAAILGHVKRFDLLRAQQWERRWHEVPAVSPAGRTLAIVGLGSIGSAVARRARAFGMRVVGVRTRSRPSPDADRTYPVAELPAAVAEADYVVNTVPATPETTGLFDAALFARFRPGAYFVNVGRGTTVDEPALIAALRSGRLGGAAVDVVANEPLAPDDPLWTAPNLLISPHCASLEPGAALDRIVDVLIENLRRFAADLPLVNVATRGGHLH